VKMAPCAVGKGNARRRGIMYVPERDARAHERRRRLRRPSRDGGVTSCKIHALTKPEQGFPPYFVNQHLLSAWCASCTPSHCTGSSPRTRAAGP
jgi:hypothetical protein